VGHNHKTI